MINNLLMEFERSIFRIHEQSLKSRMCPLVLHTAACLLLLLATGTFVNLVAYHVVFTGKSSVVQKALTD
jgi:hypothetical protein